MYLEQMRSIKHISIKDLKPGFLYRVDARNADFGIWMGDIYDHSINAFAISRYKFGSNYIFFEHHIDTDMWPTALPLKEIEKSPFRVKDIRYKGYINDGSISHISIGEEYIHIPNSKAILYYLNQFERDDSNESGYRKIEEKIIEKKDGE